MDMEVFLPLHGSCPGNYTDAIQISTSQKGHMDGEQHTAGTEKGTFLHCAPSGAANAPHQQSQSHTPIAPLHEIVTVVILKLWFHGKYLQVEG
jgi:hypothetical protein